MNVEGQDEDASVTLASATLASTSAAAVGVFGGSFDPVHYGHLRAALELALTFSIEEVRLIPNGQPPHRTQAQASSEQRQIMLELALANAEHLVLDTCELNRKGLSYTFDTLSALRQQRGPKLPIIFGMGADAFGQIANWHRADELLEVAHIAVLTRPGTELSQISGEALPFELNWSQSPDELLSQASGFLYKLEMTPLAISSTRIRQQIKRGWSAQYLLPDSVNHYISEQGLYR